jgi:gas vesicle protein
MGVKKSLAKGIAAGAVIGAVTMLLRHMKNDGSLDTKKVNKTAKAIRDRVAKHAKTIGGLTKEAYDNIVTTTVAEYRGVKALSEGELGDLKSDLLAGWKDIKALVKDAAGKEAAMSKARAKAGATKAKAVAKSTAKKATSRAAAKVKAVKRALKK